MRPIAVLFSLVLFGSCVASGGHPEYAHPSVHAPSSGHGVDFDYRIADTVKALYGGPYSKMRAKMPLHYPGSIAADYVNASAAICGDNGAGNSAAALKRRQICYDSKVVCLDGVLTRHCPRGGLGDPSSTASTESTIVVHLRLGDSFCATSVYALTSLRPPPVREVVDVVRSVVREHRTSSGEAPTTLVTTLVYSSHGGCENETRAYVADVVNGLTAGDSSIAGASFPNGAADAAAPAMSLVVEEGVGWRAADLHLCAMVNAAVFVQGAGGFSYLAERVRAKRGLPTVSSLVPARRVVWLDAVQELGRRAEEDAAKAKAKLARFEAFAGAGTGAGTGAGAGAGAAGDSSMVAVPNPAEEVAPGGGSRGGGRSRARSGHVPMHGHRS